VTRRTRNWCPYIDSNDRFFCIDVENSRALLSYRLYDYVDLLDLTNPHAPVFVSRIMAGGQSPDLTLRQEFAFLAPLGSPVAIWDLTDPLNPVQTASAEYSVFHGGMCVVGKTIYHGTIYHGVRMLEHELCRDPGDLMQRLNAWSFSANVSNFVALLNKPPCSEF